MNRNKLVIAVIIMLALFFGLESKAFATNYAETFFPMESENTVISGVTTVSERYYNFYLSMDGVVSDELNEIWSVAGETSIINIDIPLTSCNLNISEKAHTYDYLEGSFFVYFSPTLSYTDFGPLVHYDHQVISANPYVIINGEKNYLVNNRVTSFNLGRIANDTSARFGIELQFKIDFTAHSADIEPSEWFGITTLTIPSADINFAIDGVKYISTGEHTLLVYLQAFNNTAYEFFTSCIEEVKTVNDYLSQMFTTFHAEFLEVISGLGNLEVWLETIDSTITTKFEELINSNTTGFNNIYSAIYTYVNGMNTNLANKITTLQSTLYTPINNIYTYVYYLYNTVSAGFNNVNKNITALPELLSTYIYDATESGAVAIKEAVSAQFDELFDYLALEFVDYFTTVNGWLGRFEDKFDDQTEFVEIYMAKIYDLVGLKFDNLITYLGEEFVSYFTNIEAFIARLETSIENFNYNLDYYFGEVETRLSSIITSLGSIDTLLSGIVDGESSDSGSSGDSSSGGNNDDETSSNVFDRIEDAESEYITGSYENLDSYELPADGLNGFSRGFVSAVTFASSMMQALFVKAGAFATTISVSFMLVISSMALGLFRFFR